MHSAHDYSDYMYTPLEETTTRRGEHLERPPPHQQGDNHQETTRRLSKHPNKTMV